MKSQKPTRELRKFKRAGFYSPIFWKENIRSLKNNLNKKRKEFRRIEKWHLEEIIKSTKRVRQLTK